METIRERRDEPDVAEALFAEWAALVESGEQLDFEEFVRGHTAQAEALKQLHDDWELFAPILGKVVPGLIASDSGIVMPSLTGGPDSDADASSHDLLARLGVHAPNEGLYRFRSVIGRGGGGVVLKVWDTKLNRPLAMKVVLGHGEDRPTGHTPKVDGRTLSRFVDEARIAGQLNHPGIAPVHELGADETGRAFFTMKLVRGEDLSVVFEHVKTGEDGWNQTRALGVLLKVCEAMSYAHDKGVIHRDLKPTNVMVGRYGEVYVMDWGLAHMRGREDRHDLRVKPLTASTRSAIDIEHREQHDGRADSPVETMDGDVVGTPSYMPPEQVRGQLDLLGPHSDVYSVGAMLYQLLSERMPYVPPGEPASPRTILANVLKGPPVPLQELMPRTPRELIAICDKAMSGDWSQRYANMQVLSDDLRSYLEGRVVRAYEMGAFAEMRKWAKRKPGVTALAGLLLLALGSGIPVIIWEWRDAVVARGESARRAIAETQARVRADQALAVVQIQMAERFFAVNDDSTGLAYLASALRKTPTNESVATQVLSQLAQRILTVPLSEPLTHQGAVYFAQFSPDGQRVVTASADGTGRVWDASTGLSVTPELVHSGAVWFAQFSPDGQSVATASEDKTARVWDANTGQPLTPSLEHQGSVGYVYFSPDGKCLITGTWEPDWSVRTWDIQSGQPLIQPITDVHRLRCQPFSPDSRQFVATHGENSAQTWDTATGAPLVGPLTHDDFVWSAEFSRDGQRIVTASRDGTVRVWDAVTGQPSIQPLSHGKSLWLARFSPDGQSVLSVCGDKTVQVWDANTGRALTGPLEYEALQGGEEHFGPYRNEMAAQFSPDGQMVVVAFGARAQLLDAKTGRALTEPFKQESVRAAEFSGDGRRVVTASFDGSARVWGVRKGYPAVTSASVPVPEWIPELLEALAEKRLNDEGLIEPVLHARVPALKRMHAENPASDEWTKWAQWLLDG